MAWTLTIWTYVLITTIGFSWSHLCQEVSPDHARVRGVIVSVFSPKKETGSCLKYPCWALVKIDKVLGYGSGFNRAITLNDTVEVRFASTLLPTEPIFPNRREHLPGLSTGETFVADLRQKLNNDLSGQSSNYEIDEYEKLN